MDDEGITSDVGVDDAAPIAA
jgi:hypothetical protein